MLTKENFLYGLKQAPRMWYQKFCSYIRHLGYHRSDSDPCMYSRQLADVSWIHLILYVDDMLIAGSNQAEIGKLKRSLHDKFAMKELRQARHILGMQIERNRIAKTLRLSQSNYIQKVLSASTWRMQSHHQLCFRCQSDYRIETLHQKRRESSMERHPTHRP